jgi:hypothetical protein
LSFYIIEFRCESLEKKPDVSSHRETEPVYMFSGARVDATEIEYLDIRENQDAHTVAAHSISLIPYLNGTGNETRCWA